jgi:tetratricopeptide (TPR) repeat protein
VTRFSSPNGGGRSKHASDPERLTEGAFGRLLKDANQEFAAEVDQHAAFRRVTERLAASPGFWPRPTYWLVPATLVMLAAVVALPMIVGAVRRMRLETTPILVAEDFRGFHPKPVTVASTVAVAPPLAEPAKTARADVNRASTAKLNAPGASARASAISGDSRDVSPGVAESLDTQSAATADPSVAAGQAAPAQAAPAQPAAPGDIGSTTADCLSLARRGQTRDAEACFLKRAEGSGLGAEMALYEVARLRRDVLADARGALAALAEYRTRFPAGSLRREADMSQLELLLQLGRSDEALKQSDELLSSSASGERAAELRLLRGHILRKAQSRFAEAEHEYQLAESAGARGGEVTYFRGLCLEALGRAPEAAALFAQYLEQPQRPYADDARRRLQRLKP